MPQHLLGLVGEQDTSFVVPYRCLHGPGHLGQPERQQAPGLARLRGAGLWLRLELHRLRPAAQLPLQAQQPLPGVPGASSAPISQNQALLLAPFAAFFLM